MKFKKCCWNISCVLGVSEKQSERLWNQCGYIRSAIGTIVTSLNLNRTQAVRLCWPGEKGKESYKGK